ncbi:MAG TPA: GNAT family N-acetyltransferase [Ktedonosporobacter sp.]|jgi:GNAT superfamily N-acetyltransferase|nr:GNAT family N-acetyltransferase [Ktedonosporobacter sp.]
MADRFTIPTMNHDSATAPASTRDMEREEEALRRHYSRNPYPELTFEFTRDPGLLHQYYRIRSDEYKAVHRVHLLATEGEEDRGSHILVVRRDNFCVGGIRINTRNPRKNYLLPIEIADFRLEKHFPQLLHGQMGYCQFGALVLLPEFRGAGITTELFRRVHNKAVALNCKMMFLFAPVFMVEHYRQIFISLRLKATIHYEIDLPTYPNLEEFQNHLVSVVTDESLVGKPADFLINSENKSLTEA